MVVEGNGRLQIILRDLLVAGLGVAGRNGRVANNVEVDGVAWHLGNGRQ